MDINAKKRFMRGKLGISTKNVSSKEINSFFAKIESIKRKHAKK